MKQKRKNTQTQRGTTYYDHYLDNRTETSNLFTIIKYSNKNNTMPLDTTKFNMR